MEIMSDSFTLVSEKNYFFPYQFCSYISVLMVGLGEEARIYSLSNQDGIVVCDSGSYRHHAKPCIITMSPEGSKRHHLETTRRLLKPEVVLGMNPVSPLDN